MKKLILLVMLALGIAAGLSAPVSTEANATGGGSPQPKCSGC